MIYDQMVKEKQRIEKQIATLQTKLKDFPDGKLVSSHTGKYSKWYRSHGSSYTYIPKKERWIAEKLAHKKYLSLQLDTLLAEKKAIDFYLRHHTNKEFQAEQAFLNSSDYKELLAPHLTTLSQELLTWINSPYEMNPLYSENRVHTTLSGYLVRSKSEALIDTFLSQNQIPFRYECALPLNKTTLYPDFTIRHPRTGEFFYWEHFGLMDDPNYAQKAFSKLQTYTANGIIPSIHLITTYETRDYPLTADLIEKIIAHYFLD